MIGLEDRPFGPGIPSGTGKAARQALAISWRPGSVKAWWYGLLLLVLGASWGLQFTLLKIAVDARLGELDILAVSMALLAASTRCS